MEMLQSEMKNVLLYYETRVSAIKTTMDMPDEPSQLEPKCIRGHALLHNKRSNTNVQLAKCKQLFATCKTPASVYYSEGSSDSSSESNQDNAGTALALQRSIFRENGTNFLTFVAR